MKPYDIKPQDVFIHSSKKKPGGEKLLHLFKIKCLSMRINSQKEYHPYIIKCMSKQYFQRNV